MDGLQRGGCLVERRRNAEDVVCVRVAGEGGAVVVEFDLLGVDLEKVC